MLRKAYYFYLNGFKSMTTGKTLWIIIAIKHFIIFVILKLIFFPNYLKTNFNNDEARSNHVINSITK